MNLTIMEISDNGFHHKVDEHDCITTTQLQLTDSIQTGAVVPAGWRRTLLGVVRLTLDPRGAGGTDTPEAITLGLTRAAIQTGFKVTVRRLVLAVVAIVVLCNTQSKCNWGGCYLY